MRIFDTTLMKELKNVDEEKGWFDEGEFITWVDEYTDEKGNIVYGHEESEKIKIFYPYTDEELKSKGLYEYTQEELEEIERNNKLNNKRDEYYNVLYELSSTDYQAIKYAEGYYSDEEYEPKKKYREELREKIRELEKELEELENV